MIRFLLITLTLYGINCSAQTITVSVEDQSRYKAHIIKWTSREKQGFQDGNDVIQVEKTGTKLQTGYTVRLDGTKHAVTIRKISPEGKEIASNKLDGGDKTFGPVKTEPFDFNGRILLFYFRYIDKDSMKLFVSEIDRKNLQLINTRHLFSYRQENVGVFKLKKALEKEITLCVSNDKSRLLAIASGNGGELFSCVFTGDLQIQRMKVSKLDLSDEIDVFHGAIDNNGNSVIAMSKTRSSSETFNNSTAKKILVQTASNTEKVVDVEAWGTELEFRNAHFQVAKDQAKVYVFGDYSEKVANAGIWLSEISAGKLSVTKPKTFPYPEDFKKLVCSMGFGDHRKGDYGIWDADLQFAEFENGDIVIAGSPLRENFKSSQDSHGNMTGGSVSYFVGPIMTAFIKGNTSTFTMIPRSQEYGGASKSLFIPYKSKLVVIYNDFAKYINEPLTNEISSKRISMSKDLSLAAAVISKDGTIESRKMLVQENVYNTEFCEFLSNGKLLIPSAILNKNSNEMKVAVVNIE